MKIVLISDTHNLHQQVPKIECDVLVHAGDLSMEGKGYEIDSFGKWLREYPAEFKVFTAGNHDWMFQRNKLRALQILYNSKFDSVSLFGKGGIYYLEDQAVMLNGIKFYGSPWQPWFYDWAFNLPRGTQLMEKWEKITDDTDVLVTHGPPKGIQDKVYGENVGCDDLLTRVLKVQPKVHVFGHIHEGSGDKELNDTHFYNATVVDEQYKVVYDPYVIEV